MNIFTYIYINIYINIYIYIQRRNTVGELLLEIGEVAPAIGKSYVVAVV
jgi:hypothetical protein